MFKLFIVRDCLSRTVSPNYAFEIQTPEGQQTEAMRHVSGSGSSVHGVSTAALCIALSHFGHRDKP